MAIPKLFSTANCETALLLRETSVYIRRKCCNGCLESSRLFLTAITTKLRLYFGDSQKSPALSCE